MKCYGLNDNVPADLFVDKMRYKAVNCMCRSYRPTVPVSYVAKVLGFAYASSVNGGSEEKDSVGLEECVDWLKAHGACLVADNNGEMQLDTKVLKAVTNSVSDYRLTLVRSKRGSI